MTHNSNKIPDPFYTIDKVEILVFHLFLSCFRKQMLAISVDNKYERKRQSMPVYDVIGGLDMSHFTLTRIGNNRAIDPG